MPKTRFSNPTFIGSASFLGNQSYVAAGSPTSLTSFNAASAQSPVVNQNPGPGTILTTSVTRPIVTVNGLTPGYYKVVYQFPLISDSANTSIAISDGTTTSGYNGYGSAGWFPTTLEGYFHYTAPSTNASFEIIAGTSSGGGVAIRGDNNDATGWQINFSIEKVG